MRRWPGRLLAVGILIFAGSCRSAAAPASATDSLTLFETVWSDFDLNYAFFPLLNVDWAAVHVAYRDSIEHSTSTTQAARLIGGMIARLGDGHADLSTPVGVFGLTTPLPDPHYNPSFIEARYFASPVQRTASSRIQYTRLVDGTGYIYIGSFEGDGWGDEIDAVLSAIGNAPAIIFDIRNNRGGSENVGIAIARRFYDKERVYRFGRFRNGPSHTDFAPPMAFSIQPGGAHTFKGPIALITNRWNASAAEDFALMIAALPQAITVGDTTEGVGSHPLSRSLPNGWTYRVPQSQESRPDGFVYNFKGLPPSVSVRWDAELLSAGHEPYIDAALVELKRR